MKNKRLKIGIDIDDTIWKYHKKFFEYYGEKLGWKERVEDYNTYDLREFYNLSSEEATKLFDDFEFSESSWEVELNEGVVESLKKLHEDNDLFLITSRHEGLKEITKKKILKFIGLELPIYHIYKLNKTKIKDKFKICEELGVDILIDDGLHHIQRGAQNGILCFLIDSPWNQKGVLPKNIIRVKNWNEITKKIEEIKNEN